MGEVGPKRDRQSGGAALGGGFKDTALGAGGFQVAEGLWLTSRPCLGLGRPIGYLVLSQRSQPASFSPRHVCVLGPGPLCLWTSQQAAGKHIVCHFLGPQNGSLGGR